MSSTPEPVETSRLQLSLIELDRGCTNICGCPSDLFVNAVENGHYDVASREINRETHVTLASLEQTQNREHRLLACLGRVLIHHREDVLNFILGIENIQESSLVSACQLFIHHEKDESLRPCAEMPHIEINLFSELVAHPKMSVAGRDMIFQTAIERELVPVISSLLCFCPTLTHQSLKKLMEMYRCASLRKDPECDEMLRIIDVLLNNGVTEQGLVIYRGWDEMSQELKDREVHPTAIRVYQNHSPNKIDVPIERSEYGDRKTYVLRVPRSEECQSPSGSAELKEPRSEECQSPSGSAELKEPRSEECQSPSGSAELKEPEKYSLPGRDLLERFIQNYTVDRAMSDAMVLLATTVIFQVFRWFRN